jgi:hypothetical protein
MIVYGPRDGSKAPLIDPNSADQARALYDPRLYNLPTMPPVDHLYLTKPSPTKPASTSPRDLVVWLASVTESRHSTSSWEGRATEMNFEGLSECVSGSLLVVAIRV